MDTGRRIGPVMQDSWPSWSGRASECGPGCFRRPKREPPSTWRHRSASTLLPTSTISKPAERARGMCGKPSDLSTRCSPDANFATLANLDNRRQRGDCSGDDRDRTGNLLVANQAVEPHAKYFPHNGLDAFCCHWSVARVSEEFRCFPRVCRRFGASALKLMRCPEFDRPALASNSLV